MKKYFVQQITFIITLLVSCTVTMPQGYAGTSCQATAASPAYLAEAGSRAVYLKNILDGLHPKVALLARVGSNLEKYHIHYTHVAFVVRDLPGQKGKWTVVHLLNQCGTAHSSIYIQGLFNFFMDDLYNMDFRIIVPNQELQLKLYAALNSSLKLQIHEPNYSMLAYPFATRYQNSNQWVLEVIAAADAKRNSRKDAQHILQQNHFLPAAINVSTMEQLGASLFKANVKFDDHPQQERDTKRYSIISVDSVVDYLKRLRKIISDKSYPQVKS